MDRPRWFAAFCAVNLALILATASWSRVTSLVMRSPNGDEAFYGVQVAKLLAGEGISGTTGSGNLINLMVLLPEIPLYLALGPTDLTLMIPAAVAGFLAVLAARLLLRGGLDRPTAIIAATLMAALPIAIIVGRIADMNAWVPLVGVVALAAAFRGSRIGTLLGFLWCYYAHPTHLFVLPVLLLVLSAKVSGRTAGDRRRRIRELASIALGTVAVVGPLTMLTSDRSAIQWTYETYDFGPGNWPRYFLYFERMLLGFCEWGHPESSLAVDVAFWSVALSVLAIGTTGIVARRQWDRLALLVGLGISLAGMHLVTGPDILRPYLVRYGLYLVSPTVVAFACLLRAMLVEPGRWPSVALRYAQASAFFAIAWALLFCVRVNFLENFVAASQGQEDLRTLKTETVDPKQWAASIISRDIDADDEPGRPRAVLAEDWWTYRPLQYYLSTRDDVEAGTLEPFDGPGRDRLIRSHLEGGGYVVGTPGKDVMLRVNGIFPQEALMHWHLKSPPADTLAIYRLKRHNEAPVPLPIVELPPRLRGETALR